VVSPCRAIFIESGITCGVVVKTISDHSVGVLMMGNLNAIVSTRHIESFPNFDKPIFTVYKYSGVFIQVYKWKHLSHGI
jgi:hypothetical protein